MTSYSIYRAQSGEGIGEGPGKAAAGPDQYIWASPELWGDQALLDALRPWMTLKFQSQARFERKEFQEAWSCCVLGEFLFVTRLTLDARERYFSHARAWRVADLKPGFDPGALMGISSAFDSPGDPYGASQAPEPRMTWSDLLEHPNHRDVAVRFVSQLHAARLAGRPVVVVGEKFHSSELYVRALMFARAALPRALRHRCSTRIYTHETAYFLKLKAGLVVVPRAGIDGVVSANSAYTVLASDGTKLHGSEVEEEYGRMVVGRARKLPGALFAFADRCEPGASVDVARAAYNLADASGKSEDMNDLLENHLFARISPRVLTSEEWSHFGNDVLRKLAFSGFEWHERIMEEIRRRELSLLDAPERAIPALELRFLALGLTTEDEARRRLLQCRAEDIFEILDPARGLVEPFVKLIGDTPLPRGWAGELPSMGTPVEIVQRLVRAATVLAPGGSAWNLPLQRALERLLREGSPSAGLVDQLAQLPAPSSTNGRLVMAEVMFRGNPGAAIPKVEQILNQADRNGRRSVMHRLDDPTYRCLKEARIPPDWDKDVRDLMLMLGEPRLRQLESSRLIRLLDLDKPIPRRLIGILDEQLTAESERVERCLAQKRPFSEAELKLSLEATKALVAGNQWMRWRANTKVLPGTLRSCAKAWVLATQGREVELENWTQAVKMDLERLEVEEFRQINTIFGEVFRWPRVPMFEDEQLGDLIAMARGVPGTLALIAPTMRVDFSKVEVLEELKAPTDLLRLLESDDPLPLQWTLEDLRLFLSNAQSRSARSRGTKEVLRRMSTDPKAVHLVAEFRLSEADGFLYGLFDILYNQKIAPLSIEALERVIGGFPAPPKLKVDDDYLRKLAEAYAKAHYSGISGWLNPRATGGGLHQDALVALITGDTKPGAWEQYASIIQHSPVANPLGDLLDQMWKLSPGQQDQLDRCGARAFFDACRRHRVLLNANVKLRVPALEIAAFLRRKDDIGNIAVSLLEIGVAPPDPARFWMAFLDTLETCKRRTGLRAADRVDDAINHIRQTQRLWGRDQWLTKAFFETLKNRKAAESMIRNPRTPAP